MEIRFKDGKPLMVYGGLVAGSQECCCENPPPPECQCPNICLYDAAVISPSAMAFASPRWVCGDGYSSASSAVSDCVPDFSLPGWDLDSCQSISYFEKTTFGLHGFRSISGYVINYTDFIRPALLGNQRLTLTWAATFYLACGAYNSPVGDGFRISGSYTGYSALFTPGVPSQAWYWRYESAFKDIAKTCQIAPDKEWCVPPSFVTQTLRLPSPFNIDASRSSFMGAAWDSYTEESGFYTDPFVKSVGEDFRDAAPPATFRITTRESCRTPIPCGCDASMEGTKWLFEGQEFEFGTAEPALWFGAVKFSWSLTGSSPYVVWEAYDPDGPTDGDGNPSRLLARKRVDIYCATVEGEPTWVVLLRSTRSCYDGGGVNTGVTTDSWLGRLLCYEACEDDWHDAGDPIPSGEPEDVAFDNRDTSGDECPPNPPRPAVLITQIADC